MEIKKVKSDKPTRLRGAVVDKLAVLKPAQMTPELRGKLNYLLGEGVEVKCFFYTIFTY